MLTCCKMCAVFKLRMMIPPITHTQSADWNKHVMERNSSFQFPREPRGSELVLLCFFSFLRAKKVAQGKEWVAGSSGSWPLLAKHTAGEAVTVFSAVTEKKHSCSPLPCSCLFLDCRLHGFWLILPCFKQPPKNERKTHLKYPAT